MAAGATTTTTLTELCPAIQSEARMWFEQACLFHWDWGVIRSFMQWRDLRNGPGIAGTFAQYAQVSMGDGVEGTDYTTTSNLDTTGMVTVTATEKVINIPLTDLVKKATSQGPARIVADVGRAIGLAAAEKFDTDVMALFASLGDGTTGGNASNSPLLASEFRWYIQKLLVNKAPMPYVCIMHPWGYYEWLGESTSPLINAAASADVGAQIWRQWYSGKIMGVEMFQHPACPSATAAADNAGAVMSAWALGGTVVQDLEVRRQRDETARYEEFVGVMTYGVGVLSATMGYCLLTDID